MCAPISKGFRRDRGLWRKAWWCGSQMRQLPWRVWRSSKPCPWWGGTTAQDIKSGHVQRLNDTGFPGRTTLMKASTLSTLWDYINRAMPWTEPKSLAPNEVYSVVAYLLNLGSIVPDDLVLSNTNMAEVQNLLPNRNGMTTDHGLWPGKVWATGPTRR